MRDARDKKSFLEETEQLIVGEGFAIVSKDFERPWGGFFVIDESQAPKFVTRYFPGVRIDDLKISGKLSPKFLIVAPGQRLSWQYHDRRAEIWRVVSGEVAVAQSATDEEQPGDAYSPGDIIRLEKGRRHRLIGLDQWGVVAEIWQHTDAKRPSDESDIVRLQDDFGRKSG